MIEQVKWLPCEYHAERLAVGEVPVNDVPGWTPVCEECALKLCGKVTKSIEAFIREFSGNWAWEGGYWQLCSCGVPLTAHSTQDLGAMDEGEIDCYSYGRTGAFCECGHTLENGRDHDVYDKDHRLIVEGSDHSSLLWCVHFERKDVDHPDARVICESENHGDGFVVNDGVCVGCERYQRVAERQARELADEQTARSVSGQYDDAMIAAMIAGQMGIPGFVIVRTLPQLN